MQNYERIYAYTQDYQRLVYDFYSKHAVAYLATYYNISKADTVWDDRQIFGGAYERVAGVGGNKLTGIRFNRYLLLPVYFTEEISNVFDGQDIGYVKDSVTSVVIPSTYGIIPYVGDYIIFEQAYVRPIINIAPSYQVVGLEISINADRRFWKIKFETSDENKRTIEEQVTNTFVFFDYDKSIHTVPNSVFLTNLLYKNQTLKQYMKTKWDSNSGLYFI